MTGFMLDTNISSYIIKRRPTALVEKFEKLGETLSVSVMTAAKLRFGSNPGARSNRLSNPSSLIRYLSLLVTREFFRI